MHHRIYLGKGLPRQFPRRAHRRLFMYGMLLAIGSGLYAGYTGDIVLCTHMKYAAPVAYIPMNVWQLAMFSVCMPVCIYIYTEN